MESILDAINEWIKEILIGAINGNLSTMFGDVNEKVGTIAAEVGKTPQGWNANIFSMIQNLSENVIVPIAGLVITYVLCYELISMVTEKNNMHDVDTFMFFKWFFKAFVAVFLVTHTFDITMAVFDMAQHIVSGAAGVIGGDTNIDVTEALAAMQEGLKDMEIPELLLLVMETSLVSLCMKIMSVLITVILYGRMIEIYAYCSVSPIPFATMTNREWGQIGNNYLKGLFALGFQGFLIMICVGIYAVLVGEMVLADNLHSAIFSLAAYTVILCFSLFKSGALAKSIFNAINIAKREVPQKGGFFLAYVPVPKDLSKVKTKVAFNLTKRQILCFSVALLIGLPLFFLLKDSAGTSLAAMVMIVVMLPCFLVAMYEKHGQPLEVVIKNIIQTKFTRPKVRPYQTENLYALLEKQRALEKEVSAIVKRTDKKDAGSRRKQA